MYPGCLDYRTSDAVYAYMLAFLLRLQSKRLLTISSAAFRVATPLKGMQETAITKKLINNVDECVDDSLLGCAFRSSSVALLENYRVLVRRDVDKIRDANRVTLISGGGSGHEPAFGDFIGVGGLTAAVAGSIFASPPADHILAAIKAVQSSAGVLILVINYTGDRLNFGIALEQAKRMFPNVPLEMVVMGEDCALQSADKSAGRRGLAASLFVIKICGAMAELGMPLRDIAATAKRVIANCGTIGVSLSSCSPPGRGPIFQISESDMELGLGIHGEPGVCRLPVKSASETVDLMMSHMVHPSSATCFQLSHADSLAVLINNLGSTTQLELNILSLEVLRWLERRNAKVRRLYVGTCMSSLDMHGFSVSLLNLSSNDSWLDSLDSPCSMPGWPYAHSPYSFSAVGPLHIPVEAATSSVDGSAEEKGMAADERLVEIIGKALTRACSAIIANEQTLNELDSAGGDGDCGCTLKVGASSLSEQFSKGSLHVGVPAVLFAEIANIFERKVGGTTGALYSLFFSAASSKLMNSLTFDAWISAFIAGTEAIKRYGGAEPGDRTLVDPLSAFCEVLSKAKESKASLSDDDFFDGALQAVSKAVNETKRMRAHAGRASYVSTVALTKEDPGAYAVWLILQSVLGSVK
uniref:Triokinase/FMN cyclase n=1 Tax=Trichuris muris TaxID=70415 RepID=A0A5S6R4K6_TRIMR